MNFRSFLALPDVKAKLKVLRPKLPRKIGVPIKVEPRSHRYPLVGMAFDYLLRFELQRLAPHANVRKLRAEYAPDILEHQGGRMVQNAGEGTAHDMVLEEWAKETANRVRCVLEKARTSLAVYLKSKTPGRKQLANLAAHAIRLARLDTLFFTLHFDPQFEEATTEDIEDLLNLLAVVPFNLLLHEKVLILNPDFGGASRLIGGADGDLITGEMLVDFKTTKTDEMQPNDLDQLLGYYLLARHERASDPAFPVINRLALYFGRHGHLWALNATGWTSHPGFLEIERWFFDKAERVRTAI